MITGYVIKRSNTDYVINCDDQGNSGYNVVPKELDKWNNYTVEEVEAYLIEHPEMLLNSEILEIERLASQSKAYRDSLISSVEWRRTRHNDEVALGLEPTELLLPILEYIQALRDITEQIGFPTDIVWPIEP